MAGILVPQTDVMSQSLSVSESCSMYVVNMSVLNLSSGRIPQIWMVACTCMMLPLQYSSMIARQVCTNACCTGEMMDLVGLLRLTHTAPVGAMGAQSMVVLEVISGCLMVVLVTVETSSTDAGMSLTGIALVDVSSVVLTGDVLAAFALDIDGGHTKKAKARCGL